MMRMLVMYNYRPQLDNRVNIKTEWRQEAKELDEQLTKGKMS